MKENKWKPFYPILILFIALTTVFIAGRSLLSGWKVDHRVLLGGNLVLFIATFLSCLVTLKGINAKTGQGAIRGVYGSFMIKFFICVAAAFIYIIAAGKNVNKPALFACMGLYIVYTIFEVSILTKISNQKKNVQTGSPA